MITLGGRSTGGAFIALSRDLPIITVYFESVPPPIMKSLCTYPHYHEKEHHVYAEYRNSRALIEPVVGVRYHPGTVLPQSDFLRIAVTFITVAFERNRVWLYGHRKH